MPPGGFVSGFDHVAVPTARPDEMLRFYRTLGFGAPAPEEWRAKPRKFFSVQFGNNKINFHAPVLWQDDTFALRGKTAVPGSGDFCFVWSGSLSELRDALRRAGATIEEGPVERIGGGNGGRARGTSVYTRDPDHNLLEFILYAADAQG